MARFHRARQSPGRIRKRRKPPVPVKPGNDERLETKSAKTKTSNKPNIYMKTKDQIEITPRVAFRRDKALRQTTFSTTSRSPG